MDRSTLIESPLLVGILVGVTFGAMNLLVTWLFPLADDTPGALLLFYGPMFVLWALAAFRATRRSGRFLSGVTTGILVAFATFAVFDLMVILRVNLFLNEITGRADWRNMLWRFQASGFDSLRAFVNLEYIKGAPLKIGVASAIGAFMGVVGGIVGSLTVGRQFARS
jgi:hypothetical protein